MSSRGERARRWIVATLALLFSAGSVAAASGWAARAAGAAAGEALADTTAELGEALREEVEGSPSVDELARLSGASPIDIPRVEVEVEVETSPIVVPRQRLGRASPPPRAPGILVRASVVRAAIARGGRPSGSPVAGDAQRPPGLLLHGVSSYGTALRDGDVLTRVGGTSATSEGRVIAAVSGAVRSGAKAIDGEIWRGGRRIPIVVEIPRRKKARR